MIAPTPNLAHCLEATPSSDLDHVKEDLVLVTRTHELDG